MQLNWTTLVIIGAVLVALVLFLVLKNRKDRKELENQLNKDYKTPREGEHTEDADDLKNT